jgi:peroxiredoxin
MIHAAAVVTLCASLLAGVAGQPGSATTPATEEVSPRAEPFKVGEVLPGFTLTNAEGEAVSLAEQLAKGPVVVVFYRGSWCPYCVKALDSVEESVADINKLGATVLAISPQKAQQSVDLRKKLGLSYQLLTDQDNQLAARLGLMFTLDAETIEKYRKYGIDVGVSNGTEAWQLPIPATYVIDRTGTIRYAWTDADYTKRAPVKKVMQTLETIASEG